MKRLLITGINSFVGSHLADLLAGKVELWGTTWGSRDNLTQHAVDANLIEQDLLDGKGVKSVVKEVGADSVIHLSTFVTAAAFTECPGDAHRDNIAAATNIFDAVLEHTPDARLLNVGTGEVYGEPGADSLPIKETAPHNPLSHFAVSKATQDMLAHMYWKRRGLQVIRCHPFNLIGARQNPTFVASAFAKQIIEIEREVQRSRVMKVGNMDAERDFLDVRDAALAFAMILAKGTPDTVYNVCSAEPTNISKILDVLLGKSKASIELVEDEGLVRARDTYRVYGDNTRLTSLGWTQRYSVYDALGEVYNYWEGKIKKR